MRFHFVLLFALAPAAMAADEEGATVFRSDVSMGRIDALVTNRLQDPIGGLRKEDFVLRQDGKTIEIRNLAYEDLPADVLLLLDVSGSMKVYIERVASAAHQALSVLGDQDRVGIMVFSSRSRVRLPFEANLDRVEQQLDEIVNSEGFNGGTNINGALLEAAAYVERQGRREARHAIIIVTDDMAPRVDQVKVSAALDRADAVLMVLLAPAMTPMGPTTRAPQGRQPPMTTTWPGAGGPLGPLGGIILGRRGGPMGTPMPSPPPVVIGGGPIGGISAGSPEIARDSGGDSMSFSDGSAVDRTFERIRRRYTLYFYLPEGTTDNGTMQLDLANAARRRHPDAALQYRKVALRQEGARPGLITRVPAHAPTAEREPVKPASVDYSPPVTGRRRPAVSDSSGPRVKLPVSQLAPEEQDPLLPRAPSTQSIILVPDPARGR